MTDQQTLNFGYFITYNGELIPEAEHTCRVYGWRYRFSVGALVVMDANQPS